MSVPLFWVVTGAGDKAWDSRTGCRTASRNAALRFSQMFSRTGVVRAAIQHPAKSLGSQLIVTRRQIRNAKLILNINIHGCCLRGAHVALLLARYIATRSRKTQCADHHTNKNPCYENAG
jgi:hypothetical protein